MSDPTTPETVHPDDDLADAADAALDLVDAPGWARDTDDLTEAAAGSWRIITEADAEWAMRKLARAEDAVRARAERAQEYVDSVSVTMADWLEAANRADHATADFMLNRLEDYARRRLADDPKAKSLKLPHGTIQTTSRTATVRIADRAALATWARKHLPDLVEQVVEWKPDTNAIKALVRLDDAGRPAIVNETTGAMTPVDGFDPVPARVDVTVTPEVTA